MKSRSSMRIFLGCAALVTACGGTPAPLGSGQTPLAATTNTTQGTNKPPVNTPPVPVKREEPPPPAPVADLRLTAPVWSELKTGLAWATVERQGLPVVEIRVIVQAGLAAEGDRPGTAAVLAELLKEGGAGTMTNEALLARVDAMGSSLQINVDADRTTISMKVVRDDLGKALDLLATLVTNPRLGQSDFETVKKRKSDEAFKLAQEDGSWAASYVFWRELFRVPTGRHPYATTAVEQAEFNALKLDDCQAFHRKFYVPSNTFVVIAGATTNAVARPLVEKAFGGYKGPKVAVMDALPPTPTPTSPIVIVDQPGNVQSTVYVGALGLARSDKRYAEFVVLNRVLGGKGTGRLFMDVREKQSLSYNVRSYVEDHARGPAVLYASAATETPKTEQTVRALVEHFERLGKAAPTAEEVTVAARFLAEDIGAGTEELSGLADLVVNGRILGLPDGAMKTYHQALLGTTSASVGAVGAEVLGGKSPVIAVAGDAAIIAPMLSHLRDVRVLDPKRGFAVARSLPKDSSAR